MRLTTLSVANYKSLRNIRWTPGPLTVVIGANASGKSNLADCHDFLSDLYRHGLAVAVARKGGYENIAHRKMRRSRGSISVEITAEMSAGDIDSWMPYKRRFPPLRFTHSFSFRAENRAIRSDFRIEHELILFERALASGWQRFAEIERTGNKVRHQVLDTKHAKSEFDDILQ
jgi:predicted ATPase